LNFFVGFVFVSSFPSPRWKRQQKQQLPEQPDQLLCVCVLYKFLVRSNLTS
jgi:hypothetical protein